MKARLSTLTFEGPFDLCPGEICNSPWKGGLRISRLVASQSCPYMCMSRKRLRLAMQDLGDVVVVVKTSSVYLERDFQLVLDDRNRE